MTDTSALRFQSAYSTFAGSRTLESFERMTGAGGWSDVSYEFFNTFDVQAVPEMTQVALPVFGGLMVVAGAGAMLRRRWAASKL
jgi:hypothetical protein